MNTNFLVLIIFFFNNFEETSTKLAFLLSTVEGERWMPHLKQVSAYTRNKKGKSNSCLKDLSSEDCLRILPSPV